MRKNLKKSHLVKEKCYEFLNTGLACHALCALDHIGIVEKLQNGNPLRKRSLSTYKNPCLIQAALTTLIKSEVLEFVNEGYQLTEFGSLMVKNIGLLNLPFKGYRKLFEKQFDLLDNPINWSDADIDYSSVAQASINFGLEDLDPLLLELFKKINPKGTICDLGCGTAEKLTKICKELNVSGLGIEKDSKVLKSSKQFTKSYDRIEVIQGDITDLNGIWEDVEIVMTSFVFHDIIPADTSKKLLNSLIKHFPRLRCLLVVDIVSFSMDFPNILPGFEYVHGLQGMIPRNYEENLEVFSKGGFKVANEIQVPNMPNTFIWVLEPNKNSK